MIESIKPKNTSLSATLSVINTKHASTVIKMTLGLGFVTNHSSLMAFNLVNATPFKMLIPFKVFYYLETSFTIPLYVRQWLTAVRI